MHISESSCFKNLIRRLPPGRKISFSEYHSIRNSSSSFNLPNYFGDSSSSQKLYAHSSKEAEIKIESPEYMMFQSYQDNITTTSSDSSESSDDNYVPPKKLRAVSSRKQTRSSRNKKEETTCKPSQVLRCLMCSRRFKHGWDLTRHVESCHSEIKSEPEDEQVEDIPSGEEVPDNVDYSESSATYATPSKENNKSCNQVTCNNCNRKFRSKDALQRHVTGDHCIMNPPLNAPVPADPTVPENEDSLAVGQSVPNTSDKTNAAEGSDYVNVKEEDDFDDMKDSDYSVSSEESDKKEKKPRAGPSKEKPIFKCEVCNKQFKLKESYTTHTRIHTGEKPFTCHMCGKQFSHSGGLSYHLRHVHMGIKEHPCDICGRKFALKAAMQDHRRIHTGERPYVCDVCGKSFKSKASLYIHSKTHTDQFPHPCEYCSKKFRWRQQLLGHLTTHTGEKKHHCKVCNKGFGVRNDLTRHERIHSGQKPFKCSVCGLAFGQKRYLKNHLKSRHGILRMENIEASIE